MPAREQPRSHRPRPRPGADRVPADLLQRPPADRAGAARLARPRRRLHRRDPARHDGGGADLLPRRPLAHRRRLARRTAGADPPGQPGGEAGLVHRPRHDPDLDLRLHLQGPDRVGRAQPLPDRLGADPLLLRDDRSPSGSAPASARWTGWTAATGSSSASPSRWRWSPASRARGRRSRPASSAASTASPPPATRSCSRCRPWSSAASSSCARSAKPAAPRSAATVIATLVAFVTGYAAIAWLLRYLGSHTPRDLRRLPDRPRRPGPGPHRDRRDQLRSTP